MYEKAMTGGALAVTPGVTYGQTGSVVLAGISLVLIGIGAVFASRLRRRHDDSVVGR